MKKFNKLFTVAFLFCSVAMFGTNVKFNIDLNGATDMTGRNPFEKAAGSFLRIGGKIDGGWTGNYLVLSDDDGDGIYSGTATDVTAGLMEFRIYEGLSADGKWDALDGTTEGWVSDVAGIGCENAVESNYAITVVEGVDMTVSLVMNFCLETTGITDGITSAVKTALDAEVVSIFPNPVNDIITLNTEENVQSISICSLSGATLVEMDYNNSESINVSALSQGVYLLNYTVEGKVSTLKFIKQ